ncbi:hypothetical protein CW707_03470 [Candidatus Bathyarchaeota archaeon]|nr:MAG: hypothetical protein CW707_03470 [Candidatus Bathyarchaeota archaeon]
MGAVFSLPSVHAETGVSQVQILPARPVLLFEKNETVVLGSVFSELVEYKSTSPCLIDNSGIK